MNLQCTEQVQPGDLPQHFLGHGGTMNLQCTEQVQP